MRTHSLTTEELGILIRAPQLLDADGTLLSSFVEAILVNHPDVAISVLKTLSPAPVRMVYGIGITEADYNHIASLFKAEGTHGKVEAIKHLRTLTGIGLKEAKDYVENEWPRYHNPL